MTDEIKPGDIVRRSLRHESDVFRDELGIVFRLFAAGENMTHFVVVYWFQRKASGTYYKQNLEKLA
jgi:hypothetical protein